MVAYVPDSNATRLQPIIGLGRTRNGPFWAIGIREYIESSWQDVFWKNKTFSSRDSAVRMARGLYQEVSATGRAVIEDDDKWGAIASLDVSVVAKFVPDGDKREVLRCLEAMGAEGITVYLRKGVYVGGVSNLISDRIVPMRQFPTRAVAARFARKWAFEINEKGYVAGISREEWIAWDQPSVPVDRRLSLVHWCIAYSEEKPYLTSAVVLAVVAAPLLTIYLLAKAN